MKASLAQLPQDRRTPREKIRSVLAEFKYLTASQVTRLLYSPSSITHVKELLRDLVDHGEVLSLGGRGTGLPRVYTLSAQGSRTLGLPQRIRPSEEKDKTPPFLHHTLLVNDALIGARLLPRDVPGLVLAHQFHERELRGKLSASLAPDASLEFLLRDSHNDLWRYFFHVEVYRHLPKKKGFQQKVLGYVSLATSGKHQELFGTNAFIVALFCSSETLSKTLKAWTEEALSQQPEEGQRFFFGSIDTAKAAPAQVYLSPSFVQAFSDAKTPLLISANPPQRGRVR